MWNVGKFGDLRPYAVLEPVEVGGVTIKLATLHNEEDIVRKDIRAGEDVIVMRAGDVIPQVVSPAPHVAEHRGRPRRPRPPERCPFCDTPTVKPKDRCSRSARTATAPSAPGSCSSTSSRAARWTSTGSARSRWPASAARAGPDRRRLLPPARGAVARARGLRRDLRAQPDRGDRGLEAAAVRGVLFALGIEEVGEVTGASRAALPRYRRAARSRRTRRSRRRRGWARRWRKRYASSSTTSGCGR